VANVAEPAYIIQAFDAIQHLIKNKKILSGHDISAGGMITALLEMNFPNTRGGMNIDLSAISSTADYINVLFSENPGIIIQCKKQDNIAQQLKKSGIKAHIVGYPVKERKLNITTPQTSIEIDIDEMRDIWYETSYLLDKKQSGTGLALERFKNYKKQPLSFGFNKSFRGTFDQYQIDNFRNTQNGIKAAIIREKGVNGDREMAFSMYLAGLDVKDIHMTDLISGRETLEDINMIVFVGGFSNSDVLGSAKGWAGAFLYNAKAKKALDNFYKRNNTLSLGVCNGCQLMIELGLITPNHKKRPKMLFNDTGKFESAFLNVDIPQNHSVMLHTLAGSRMGIWIAHGEGKFSLPLDEHTYHIPMKYSYDQFPGNPNGSDYATAALCSDDGRHLAMMPHIERSIFPWQWAYYPESGKTNTITPWIEAFVNAREWIKTSPQTIKARQ
jgi:phosphoribosylformylglycinamidine synthase